MHAYAHASVCYCVPVQLCQYRCLHASACRWHYSNTWSCMCSHACPPINYVHVNMCMCRPIRIYVHICKYATLMHALLFINVHLWFSLCVYLHIIRCCNLHMSTCLLECIRCWFCILLYSNVSVWPCSGFDCFVQANIRLIVLYACMHACMHECMWQIGMCRCIAKCSQRLSPGLVCKCNVQNVSHVSACFVLFSHMQTCTHDVRPLLHRFRTLLHKMNSVSVALLRTAETVYIACETCDKSQTHTVTHMEVSNRLGLEHSTAGCIDDVDCFRAVKAWPS